MHTVILLPTYNERENVETIIPEIFTALPDAHILVIDDNSPDGTGTVVEQMTRHYPQLLLLRRKKKEGLGEAYKHAYRKILQDTKVEAVITMDADGSHNPAYLPQIVQALEEHDVVVGSRYVSGGGIENWETWRYLLSKYGNLYSFFLTGLRVFDLTAGFIGMRRSILERVELDKLAASGYAYQIELKFHLVHKQRGSIKEIPIIFKSRRGGESKISQHIIREGLYTPLRLFLERWKR